MKSDQILRIIELSIPLIEKFGEVIIPLIEKLIEALLKKIEKSDQVSQ